GAITNTSLATVPMPASFGSYARGDLAMRGASTYGRLGAGAAGTLLKAAGSAADLAWATFSSVFAFGSDARGDIATRGASAYGRLALGSAAQALLSDGTDALWGFVQTLGKSGADTTYNGSSVIGSAGQESLSGTANAS